MQRKNAWEYLKLKYCLCTSVSLNVQVHNCCILMIVEYVFNIQNDHNTCT